MIMESLFDTSAENKNKNNNNNHHKNKEKKRKSGTIYKKFQQTSKQAIET